MSGVPTQVPIPPPQRACVTRRTRTLITTSSSLNVNLDWELSRPTLYVQHLRVDGYIFPEHLLIKACPRFLVLTALECFHFEDYRLEALDDVVITNFFSSFNRLTFLGFNHLRVNFQLSCLQLPGRFTWNDLRPVSGFRLVVCLGCRNRYCTHYCTQTQDM